MKHVRIGITQGDINGIGYESLMTMLAEQKMYEGKTFIVYGSSKVASFHRKSLDLPNFNFNLITSAEEAAPKRPNIINCVDDEIRVDVGMATVDAGRAALASLRQAVADLKDGKIDILVTLPVDKDVVRSAGIDFTTHTTYMAQALGTTQQIEFFLGEGLAACAVTDETRISKVPQSITKDAIIAKIVAMHDTLCSDFGKVKPKIAVLSLNAEISDEEKNVIIPAIEETKNSGYITVGPYMAENFFTNADYARFDGVVAMYRDQIVTPFMALSYDSSIVYSAGLPYVVASPVMSVGYATVGKNCADDMPLKQAVFAACDILEERERYIELTKNQLK